MIKESIRNWKKEEDEDFEGREYPFIEVKNSYSDDIIKSKHKKEENIHFL